MQNEMISLQPGASSSSEDCVDVRELLTTDFEELTLQ